MHFKLASGLYLNEENGQTFEIVDTSKEWIYIQFPDFFWESIVYADEQRQDIIDLIFEGKISYIGEV